MATIVALDNDLDTGAENIGDHATIVNRERLPTFRNHKMYELPLVVTYN